MLIVCSRSKRTIIVPISMTETNCCRSSKQHYVVRYLYIGRRARNEKWKFFPLNLYYIMCYRSIIPRPGHCIIPVDFDRTDILCLRRAVVPSTRSIGRPVNNYYITQSSSGGALANAISQMTRKL